MNNQVSHVPCKHHIYPKYDLNQDETQNQDTSTHVNTLNETNGKEEEEVQFHQLCLTSEIQQNSCDYTQLWLLITSISLIHHMNL